MWGRDGMRVGGMRGLRGVLRGVWGKRREGKGPGCAWGGRESRGWRRGFGVEGGPVEQGWGWESVKGALAARDRASRG